MKKSILLLVAVIKIVSANGQAIAGGVLGTNNIRANINSDGTLFMDSSFSSLFEVPQGSGKQTIYAGGLWIGGYDAAGSLKLAAQTYRQTGTDFFPGPVDTAGVYGSSYDSTYNRVWKINKCDIDAYYNWMSSPEAEPLPEFQDTTALEVINNWPAFNMYGEPLAPFKDINSDGLYDPTLGDVPLIKGDQAVFFVYNDSRASHTETAAPHLNVEIQGMAYAYNCSEDSALYNTVFTNYKIVNKSAFRIDSAFVGNWTDFDIGYYGDDFVGCDVTRGAYYAYNATAIDGSGQAGAYGANPPAQALVFLKGPFANPNNVDDPQNTYVNALNCGDGITDNERLGMSKFVFFNNNSNSVNGNPGAGDDFYQYLSGSWKDGTLWTFDNDGTNGTVVCDYMFPGTSDPYGYGIGGSITNPVSLSDWDEFSEINAPGDRRGLGSYGPFTLNAGASTEIDFAYVYGRATSGGNLASIAVMKSRIDSVRQKFMSAPDNTIEGCTCNNTITGIKALQAPVQIVLYPNPVNDNLIISYKTTDERAIAQIYDATGRMVQKIELSMQSEHAIAVKVLSRGLYILQIQDGERTVSKRFLKE